MTNPTPPEDGTRRVGAYRLLEKLGEGGMGEVWSAQLSHPVRRVVALKLIKAGLDTHDVLARFEAERQALALMEHPAIAQVFDAGVTEDGRSYIAMEYVKGMPITLYCDRSRLSVRERLRLFQAVCEGVQHAHQKTIIHRDLKPTNVLVTEVDGRAQPKIIDFGVAKALGSPLTDATLYTRVGEMVGTPEYMAPEQADASAQDVDTRVDVYALGVMLYEMLVGALPFEPAELRRAGFEGLLQILREREPPRPSRRLSDLAETTQRIAVNRRTEPMRLEATLRGDLDWIVMKALEKDRTRRYGSPRELSEDVQRHLDHEPVLAGPPRVSYRARKFLRRHRLGVVALGASLLVLLAFASTMAVQAKRIAHQRDRALTERARAEAIAEFLGTMIEGIQPEVARDRDTTLLREILDGNAGRVDRELGSQPEVAANLHQTLGNSYHALGEYDRGEQHLLRALELYRGIDGTDGSRGAIVENDLAVLYLGAGELERARELVDRAWTTVSAQLGANDPNRWAILGNRGQILCESGDVQQGLPLLEEALAGKIASLGETHEDSIRERTRIGQYLEEIGRIEEAEQSFERAVHLARDRLGTTHPVTIAARANLATFYLDQGRFAQAEPMLRDQIEVAGRVHGEEHPTTITLRNNLAGVLDNLGREDEAESLFRSTVALAERVHGPDHLDTANVLNNLANLLTDTGQEEEAEELLRRALRIRQSALGDAHPMVLTVLNNLGFLYRRQGRFEEALPCFEKSLAGYTQALGAQNPSTLVVQSNLGELHFERGAFEEAERLHRSTLEGLSRALPPDHYLLGLAHMRHGAALRELGSYGPAEEALLRGHRILQAGLGDPHERTQRAVDELVRLYRAWEAADPGRGHADEALRWAAAKKE